MEEFDFVKLNEDCLIHVFFFLSLLLEIVTLALFLGLYALRKRVYDKCFICYLITVTVMLTFVYIFKILWNTTDDDDVEEAFFNFIFLSITFWLNIMCIQLWRSVRSMKQIPEGKLLYYALYAWGCPLILSGVNFTVCKVLRKSEIGEYFDLLIAALILIINLCLVFHVAIIIWQQKKQYKGNTEFRCRRHIRQHKRRLLIILELFLIMGLVEWNHFFFHSCYKKISGIPKVISGLISMCPGFAIFVTFVCCNKKVVSALKRGFKIQSDIPDNRLQNVQHPHVGNEIADINFIEVENPAH